MISSEKLPSAYYALNGVLITARQFAEMDGTCDRLRMILDYAEELPRLLAAQEDETEAFRATLVEVAERFQCAFLLQRFDDPPPSKW
jgi:hypothetical protein